MRHLASQYPWLIFRGDVCARRLGFGFGYKHGGEIPVFFYDALGPSHTEHRHLLSTVVELPYVLDLGPSLNQVMKLELCSLISRGSWSVTCSPWSLYFFLITSLCFIIQGSTSWMCCSATRLALSKSMPRPSKLTCISQLPSRCPPPSILPKCLLTGRPTGFSVFI